MHPGHVTFCLLDLIRHLVPSAGSISIPKQAANPSANDAEEQLFGEPLPLDSMRRPLM